MGHNFRFCPYCGGELKEDYKFCPYCGKPLESSESIEKPFSESAVVKEHIQQISDRSKEEFSLSYIPRGKPEPKKVKRKVKVIGVDKNLRFNGSKGTKFGKLALNEALALFERLPREYPYFSEDANPIVFELNDGALRIGLRADGQYQITSVLPIRGTVIGFTLLEHASFEEALGAIERFYKEKDFCKNAYYAKERYLEKQEVREGKYLLKMPGIFVRYDGDVKIPSVLYLTAKGLEFYGHEGIYYSMEMPENLPYFAREGIRRIKFNKKRTEIEVTYVDDSGEEGIFKYVFLIPEEGERYYQVLSSHFPGKVKIGGWF
ncbi:zinc ribbon domain-containing protein [Thermococcus barophilus]|uniref:DUF7575 domain-containing protein n=1 Tax=Thermococcus barophilus TaxID=55802 RepID=A0A0S1XBY5_THEBA|nr:zinc ribbon domain-containing protein [Thermococcus barophilus]ALM75306.1 hypothetical protein TBCH5v1_1389 [Thermococcus barophilus]